MSKRKLKMSNVTAGSIFDDRDLFTQEEGAVLTIKSDLMGVIGDEVKRNRYTQVQLAKVLQEYQPNVSNLLGGHISKFSIDKLVRYVTRLGLKVEMRVEVPVTAGKSTASRAPRSAPRRKNGRAAA